MLFNSYPFLLVFLPLTLAGYLVLIRGGSGRPAKIWLAAASLVFYTWWRPANLAVLLFSLGVNYGLGRVLLESRGRGLRRAGLILGVAVNLALLGYFKYSAFVVDQVSTLSGLDFAVRAVVLPLGISFFTFQQIAYLADAAEGEAEEPGFVDYVLFVTFFPQLIAGPIVHHREMMGQFAGRLRERISAESFALGLTFLIFGLMKKILVADPLALTSTAAFTAAADGAVLSAASAWTGVGAYTLQIYFDFSGYSDMAVGLGLLFGIKLPFNFNSPYKAESISDFWRRWHMTLSRFLRDYVYIPLGGNRRGPRRRYLNLFLTMALGGVWHGAGWTFMVWGALHGAYLAVNHAWDALRARLGLTSAPGPVRRWTARLTVLFFVMIAWVFFRAPDVPTAFNMLGSMFGAGGWVSAADPLSLALQSGEPSDRLRALKPYLEIGFWFAVALIAPNTQEIIEGAPRSGWSETLRWRPSPAWAAALSVGLLFALTRMSQVSEFLYFQF